MKNKIKLIMLVDDNEDDNFYHEREISKYNGELKVVSMELCREALEYLRLEKKNESMLPDLIFLDINMPRMNGWEFLNEYDKIDKELVKKGKIIMLTSSDNPQDIERAKTWSFVSDYYIKPLTREKMLEIVRKYF